jgi:hypothetical protein
MAVCACRTGRGDVQAQAGWVKFMEARAKVPREPLPSQQRCIDLLDVAGRCWMVSLWVPEGNYTTLLAPSPKSDQAGRHLAYDEPWGWIQPVRHALRCS